MQTLSLFKLSKASALEIIYQLTTVRLVAVSTIYAFVYLDCSQIEAIKNKFGEVLTCCEPFEMM